MMPPSPGSLWGGLTTPGKSISGLVKVLITLINTK